MSNFICPTCGLTNIDCGKTGYKTEREIELEEELAGGLERERIHLNRALEAEKKLEIAVKALEMARDTAYQSTHDCMICQFIDDFLTKKLTEIKKCI